jgi:hypothetical protein
MADVSCAARGGSDNSFPAQTLIGHPGVVPPRVRQHKETLTPLGGSVTYLTIIN